MKIGLDMSPLQGAHRMRGIGYVTRNFIENIPKDYLENKFVFYVDRNAKIKPSEMIDNLTISKNLQYELRYVSNTFEKENKTKIEKIKGAYKKSSSFRRGLSDFEDTQDLEAFIQFDQSKPFPKLNKRTRKILIAYDLIPYILQEDYMWNYKTSRIKGQNRKASIKNHIKRNLYKKHIQYNSKMADIILAISEVTKNDFIKYLKVDPNKIRTIQLGAANFKDNNFAHKEAIEVGRYRNTSFGYMPRPYKLHKDDKFIIFVGGADPRRKLGDLVATFNQLRARGVDIKLILAGDTMKGVDTIPTPEAHHALRTTSYLDDIIFVGFIDDNVRDWLYKNTNALVFPSIYEGYGLPVVEALQYGTNVISYDNQATIEIAGDLPLYANDTPSLMKSIEKCLYSKKSSVDTKNIKTTTWTESADSILKSIV